MENLEIGKHTKSFGLSFARVNQRQGVNLSANGLVSCIVGAIVISGMLIAGFYLLY